MNKHEKRHEAGLIGLVWGSDRARKRRRRIEREQHAANERYERLRDRLVAEGNGHLLTSSVAAFVVRDDASRARVRVRIEPAPGAGGKPRPRPEPVVTYNESSRALFGY